MYVNYGPFPDGQASPCCFMAPARSRTVPVLASKESHARLACLAPFVVFAAPRDRCRRRRRAARADRLRQGRCPGRRRRRRAARRPKWAWWSRRRPMSAWSPSCRAGSKPRASPQVRARAAGILHAAPVQGRQRREGRPAAVPHRPGALRRRRAQRRRPAWRAPKPTLAQAKALAERYKPLVEANAVSKQEYANAVAAQKHGRGRRGRGPRRACRPPRSTSATPR